jgi:hypothetical protein
MYVYPCPIHVEAGAIEWVIGHGIYGILARLKLNR